MSVDRTTTEYHLTPGECVMGTQWKLECGPDRDSARDRSLAVFYDADYRVEVSIPTRMLGQIGNQPDEANAKERHAVEILVAMLEEFKGEIKADQLTRIDETMVDMSAVQRRFTEGKKTNS